MTGLAVAISSSAVYVLGSHTSQVFSLGNATIALSPSSAQQLFLAKLSLATGSTIWLKPISSLSLSQSPAVISAASGVRSCLVFLTSALLQMGLARDSAVIFAVSGRPPFDIAGMAMNLSTRPVVAVKMGPSCVKCSPGRFANTSG